MIELDGRPGSYRLHVSSPAGDDSVDVGLDPACLGVDLDTLQARVLASATTSRAVVPELERPLRQVGQALFEAVFRGSAGALFLSSRNEAERAGGRLRIVLRLHPPELAVLPWELLFSDHYGGYLCRRSAMVRYVDVPEPVRPLTVTPPLRVLGMTALPGDLAALDADTEQRRLQQMLAPLQARGLIAVDWVPGQSWEAAQEALYAGCQVFHFIGHGGFDADRGEGVIAFADERGRRQLVRASSLAELLSVADPMPRLVVLNSCQTGTGADTDVFSSTAATLVRTVPAVVAMQFAVTDEAAAVFSRAFYQALVHNRGVDEAVRDGRIALTGWNPDTLEWVTPVLYLRSRDTRLFDLTPPGGAPPRADDQLQLRREAVLAAYWAARSTGDWEPVISQLGVLHRELPGDREVEQAYRDARLAARYAQGRRAEEEQDWAGAVVHYQAVSDAQPGYRDAAARLAECGRRRDIAALQERLRTMFTAGKFQAVVGIADRLAELDPAAADPDGLSTQARQRLQRARREAQEAGRQRAEEQAREKAERRARDLANHYALACAAADAQDWDQALTAFTMIAEIDPGYRDVQQRADNARKQQLTARLRTAGEAQRQARQKAEEQARREAQKAAKLELSALAVDFGRIRVGSKPEPRRVTVLHGGNLNVRITSAPGWIQAQHTGDTLTLRPDPKAPGSLTGDVQIDSNGGSARIRVTAMVESPGIAPTRGYYQGDKLATWWQRVGAHLIDWLPLIPGIVLWYVAWSAQHRWGIAIGVLATAAPWLYNRWYLQGRTGQSWGKRAMGLKLIAMSDKEPIGWWKAAIRDLAHYFLDILPLCIGFLLPIWDAQRQTLADQAMSTVVISCRRQR